MKISSNSEQFILNRLTMHINDEITKKIFLSFTVVDKTALRRK